jgi:hypothetical protein
MRVTLNIYVFYLTRTCEKKKKAVTAPASAVVSPNHRATLSFYTVIDWHWLGCHPLGIHTLMTTLLARTLSNIAISLLSEWRCRPWLAWL